MIRRAGSNGARRPQGRARGMPGPAAFTLVELLVVISIIALVVTILLPSLMRVRAYTRLVLCQTRIRTQAQAHALYGADHDGNKPPLLLKRRTTTKLDWASPDTKWINKPVGQGLLVEQGYLEFEALLCPSASMDKDAAVDRAAWNELMNAGSSYVYFWRHPSSVTDMALAAEGATYARAEATGRTGLSMDINAEAGHKYIGEYEGRAWVSHPVMGRVNVGFTDASVHSASNRELLLRFPGGPFEELLWWEQAHGLR